jgi:NAD(P)-dependent dehydrogenase (short-subunit alcohol dehydrogenase family)
MTKILPFTGFIKGVTYKTHLAEKLAEFDLSGFDVNAVAPCGLIESPINEIAYSKWVSPKRTRSYPFARIYNT